MIAAAALAPCSLHVGSRMPPYASRSTAIVATTAVKGYFEPRELRRLADGRSGMDCELVEGELVEVIVDVMRAAKGVENARGLRGKIVDVYASCEIDPACCCNELATDATITVLLDVPE